MRLEDRYAATGASVLDTLAPPSRGSSPLARHFARLHAVTGFRLSAVSRLAAAGSARAGTLRVWNWSPLPGMPDPLSRRVIRTVGAVGAGGGGLRLTLAAHIGYAEYWHTLVGQNVLWRQ